jgi:hypothetical protein
VTLVAHNAQGQQVGQASAPNQQGVIHELEVTGEGIVGAVLRGGGGEGLLIAYCVEGIGESSVTTSVTESVASGIMREMPSLSLSNRRIQANRCCFTGAIDLPPTEKPGQWDVHLTVQNVNHVPEGTPPEQAATVIGGHLISSHTAPDVVGCTVLMLLDHVFDVI